MQKSGSYFYDGLDNTGFRFGVGFEVCQDPLKTGSMSDPRIRIDRAVLNQADDSREVRWQRVA